MSEQPASTYPQLSTSPPGILIPFTADKLFDFICGLLAKAQVAEGQIIGNFDLEIADVENFFHLIDQRVQEQNQANLVQFTVKLLFTDGSSVLLPTLQQLQTYSEVRQ